MEITTGWEGNRINYTLVVFVELKYRIKHNAITVPCITIFEKSRYSRP